MLFITALAFNFISCSNDNDPFNEDGTLTIDGISYECTGIVSQGYINGIYLTFDILNGKELTLVITSKEITELKAGDLFDIYGFYVRDYGTDLDTDWDEIDGNIFVSDIKESSLTIKIENLVIINTRGITHKISGEATLYHSVYDSNGNRLPFGQG